MEYVVKKGLPSPIDSLNMLLSPLVAATYAKLFEKAKMLWKEAVGQALLLRYAQ